MTFSSGLKALCLEIYGTISWRLSLCGDGDKRSNLHFESLLAKIISGNKIFDSSGKLESVKSSNSYQNVHRKLYVTCSQFASQTHSFLATLYRSYTSPSSDASDFDVKDIFKRRTRRFSPNLGLFLRRTKSKRPKNRSANALTPPDSF